MGICLWYEIARTQRKHELERGEGLECTRGYEIARCYECDGSREECESYQEKS